MWGSNKFAILAFVVLRMSVRDVYVTKKGF